MLFRSVKKADAATTHTAQKKGATSGQKTGVEQGQHKGADKKKDIPAS